jgi:hypothetical protein
LIIYFFCPIGGNSRVDLDGLDIYLLKSEFYNFHRRGVMLILYIRNEGSVNIINYVFTNCKSEIGSIIFPGGYSGALLVDVTTNITSCLFDCCYAAG